MSNESKKLEEDECPLCTNKICLPRVLTCLHVFCEACLDKILIEKAVDSRLDSILKCPLCQQETTVGPKGAASLPCDHVLTNILDMSTIENMLCTSCKTMEKAVSRCSDCANFLCLNCNTAHQFMRCFENHKVVSFEDLMKSKELIPIHKPIFCQNHPTENLKFYCNTCQELICNDCLLLEHKLPDHQYERLIDAEPRLKVDLLRLLHLTKSMVADCGQTTNRLENALKELQIQRDKAKDLITDIFHSYRAVLEKIHDLSLSELESLHSERELKLMDHFNSVDKTLEKIDSAYCFTSRLLEHGDAVEILSLQRIVSSQLINLLRITPKPVSFSIEFYTDCHHFEKTVKQAFGSFRTESNAVSKNAIGSEMIPLSIACPNWNSMTSSIGSTSAQSSPQDFLSPSSSISPDSIRGFSNIHEYNLTEKVDIVGDSSRVVGLNSNANHASSFGIADLVLDGDHAISNLRALANLGSNLSVSNATLNGDGNFIIARGQSQAQNLATLGIDGGCRPLSTRTSESDREDSVHSVPVRNHPVGSVSGTGNRNLTRIRSSSGKVTSMQIRIKFGELGPNEGQFNSPHGFCLGADEDIIVADTNNHRIQIFGKLGNFKFEFGVSGKEEGQLWYPRKVAVMRSSGKFVVCDRGNERSRMQIFTKNGHFIRKISIQCIDIVAGLAVTEQGHIVAVDSVSPTVFVFSETGAVVKWFSCGDYMREPSDIAISEKEYFICDFKGHCVVVFNEDGQFLRRIGWENITNYPNGIDISDEGDVLIGDSHGNRFHVVIFSRSGSLLTEFECPYVKVSRCCGLKITSEGYVVTLAKNNHHVLVLNTLYII